MDIVFFGSGAFGLPTLRRLAERHTLRAVVSQPDRPAGRGRTLTPTPVAQLAATLEPAPPLLRPERLRDAIDEVRAIPADAWVVIAYGQKLPPALLDGRFAVNLHASLLPRWRGAAPVNWSILDGDDHAGNSVITLADRMDAGLVLAQSPRPRDPRLTAGELHDRLADEGPDLVDRVLDDHARNALNPRVQDETLVTLARKLGADDRPTRFDRPAPRVRDHIHGLNPWPGATASCVGEPLRLHRAAVETLTKSDHAPPGTLLDASGGIVACADATALRLLSVQPAGGREMEWHAYANGRRIQAGEQLGPLTTLPGGH